MLKINQNILDHHAILYMTIKKRGNEGVAGIEKEDGMWKNKGVNFRGKY